MTRAWPVFLLLLVPTLAAATPALRLGGDLGVYARDDAGGQHGIFPTLQLRGTWLPALNVGAELGYGLVLAPALVPAPAVDELYHRVFVRLLGRVPTAAGAVLVGLGPVVQAAAFTIRDVAGPVVGGTRTAIGVGGGLFYEHDLGALGLRTGLEWQWTPDRLDVAVVLGGSFGPEGDAR